MQKILVFFIPNIWKDCKHQKYEHNEKNVWNTKSNMSIAKMTFVLNNHMQTEILVNNTWIFWWEQCKRTDYELVSCPYLTAVIV